MAKEQPEEGRLYVMMLLAFAIGVGATVYYIKVRVPKRRSELDLRSRVVAEFGDDVPSGRDWEQEWIRADRRALVYLLELIAREIRSTAARHTVGVLAETYGPDADDELVERDVDFVCASLASTLGTERARQATSQRVFPTGYLRERQLLLLGLCTTSRMPVEAAARLLHVACATSELRYWLRAEGQGLLIFNQGWNDEEATARLDAILDELEKFDPEEGQPDSWKPLGKPPR